MRTVIVSKPFVSLLAAINSQAVYCQKNLRFGYVSTQITPRTKPRAFPRTNPRVGVARTDGFSTCRRGNEHNAYRHQAAYDVCTGQPVMQSGIGPAAAINVDYSTLRSYRPAPNHGHDIGDSSHYPMVCHSTKTCHC